PAAAALLWALLLSLGSRAAGAQGLTSTATATATQRDTFRFGGPMTHSYRTTARSRVTQKIRVTMEDEDDIVAAADRMAGPVGSETSSTIPTRGFSENGHDSENTMSSSQPPSTGKTAADQPFSDSTRSQWSTARSSSNPWPPPSPTAMPAPEDLQLVLGPWGPWHCHCKSGTMSRSRGGKLHGLSGRLRVGALSQLHTEHRPCTYHICPCNRQREECPLDAGLCPDTSCTTQTTTKATTTTTTTPIPPLVTRLRPTPFIPSPSPRYSSALAFWKRVRIGLEDIWNSLSSVFTEMQPINRNQR
uniref:Protein MENT n=1 Tax=Camelus bactrianus TaxID=9837 RepID=A0A9W3HKG5_CAMBA